MSLLALLLAAAAAAAPNGPAAPAAAPTSEAARYAFSGPAPWSVVKAVEAPGYRVVLSSADGASLSARVEVDASPLPDDAPFPPDPRLLPAEAREALAVPEDGDAALLSRLLTGGSSTVLEAVERVVAYTSRRIRYELPGAAEETALLCRTRGRGSCVGRSLLAADLLRRAGVPARQVTGVLVAEDAAELSPESRGVYSEALGGVRHRWIEAFVPGLGWVPSDPGGLANAVTARHLALAAAPVPGFAVRTLGRSRELRWPRLSAIGPGTTLARPRSAAPEAAPFLGRER